MSLKFLAILMNWWPKWKRKKKRKSLRYQISGCQKGVCVVKLYWCNRIKGVDIIEYKLRGGEHEVFYNWEFVGSPPEHTARMVLVKGRLRLTSSKRVRSTIWFHSMIRKEGIIRLLFWEGMTEKFCLKGGGDAKLGYKLRSLKNFPMW